MSFIYLVSEDLLSEYIAQTIVKAYTYNHPYPLKIRGGKSHILKNLLKYNQSAKNLKFLIIVDLDKTNCVVDFIKKHFHNVSLNKGLIFRVAIREIESWILADKIGFCNYFKVPKKHLQINPDDLHDPKQFLIETIKKYCKNKRRKEDITVQKGSNAIVGPAYNSALIEFIKDAWCIESARQNSPSLNRCIVALEKLSE